VGIVVTLLVMPSPTASSMAALLTASATALAPVRLANH
jgi:hypothetical protein